MGKLAVGLSVVAFIALCLLDWFAILLAYGVGDGSVSGGKGDEVVFVLIAGTVTGSLCWCALRTTSAARPHLVCCIIVTLVAVFVIARIQVWAVAPSYLSHRPSSEATIEAQRDLARSRGCVTLTQAGVLPPPYERCVSAGRVTYSKGADSNQWDNSHWGGLVYVPGATDAVQVGSDMCVRRLGGPWVAFMGEKNPMRPCAKSFEFVGGG